MLSSTYQIVKTDNCPVCGKIVDWVSMKIPGLKKEIIIPDCNCKLNETPQSIQIKKQNRIDRIQDILKKSHLPSHYDKFNLNTFPVNTTDESQSIPQKSMLSHCREYIKNWNCRQLFLWGKTGTGKSAISTIIARSIIWHSLIKTRFVTQGQMAKELSWGINEDELKITPASILKYYCEIPLLIIDEYSYYNSSQSERRKAFEVINLRYMNDKSTIITTNDPIPQIKDPDTVRIWRRMIEKPNLQIPFSWDNLTKN